MLSGQGWDDKVYVFSSLLEIQRLFLVWCGHFSPQPAGKIHADLAIQMVFAKVRVAQPSFGSYCSQR